MKKILKFSKILLSIVFTILTVLIIYFFLFSSKDKRFSLAEHSQGSYFSQTLFDILIFQDKKDSNSFFEKSVAYNKRGDYSKGFELLNKAVELKPDLHLGYRGWLRLVKIKDYRGCIKDLKRLDSLTPNFTDYPWSENIYYLIGLSYKGLNLNDEALEEFDRAINSVKDSSLVNPNLFLHKGLIFKKRENYNEAILNFNTCLKFNYYNSPEAYYQKGLVFNKINQPDSAKINFKKSLTLFNKGYTSEDKYNEVQDELYLSDILIELDEFSE